MQKKPEPRPHPVTAPGGAGVLVFAILVLCAGFGEVATGVILPALPALPARGLRGALDAERRGGPSAALVDEEGHDVHDGLADAYEVDADAVVGDGEIARESLSTNSLAPISLHGCRLDGISSNVTLTVRVIGSPG